MLDYFHVKILQMNYEDFCHIASVCAEQIGPKCRRFFSPSNFMKFEKDEQGRIAILPFYLYVMRTVNPSAMHVDVVFLNCNDLISSYVDDISITYLPLLDQSLLSIMVVF